MTTLSFDVLWKDRGAAKGLRDLSAGADQAHGKMSKFSGGVGKGLSKAGGLVKGFGIAGVAAFAAAGAAGVAMGVKVASGNEQAKISFTTMLGSAKKADSFLRQLQQFAASTPFEFPELQTAASSLISAGINADKVIPIMRTLGDVTSGMGTGSEGVQRATVALQQMSAAGRITGEDLNQLRDAGIPVYDLLSKATGKSKEEVVKLAQAGKLGKKELGQMMEALENGEGLERFSGLMEKQSKSLAGTWSTLKDTVGQGLAGVMSNALPLMKQGITGISNLAAGAFGWVDKNKGSIGSLFKTAGASISAFGRIAAGVFSAFISSTGNATKSFKSFAQYISTNQASIIGAFVSAGKGALLFGRTLATSASTGLRAFATLLDGVTTGTQGILASVGAMAAGTAAAFGWIPGIGPKLKGAVTSFNKFSETAVTGSRKAADGARGLADGIDKNVVPAIDKGAAALDKMGKKEIIKARQRDQVAKFAIALQSIPKEKRAEIKSIFKKKGADEAYKAMEKIKDKQVIAKSKSDLKGAKAVDKAMKSLKDRLILAKSRGDTAGAKKLQAAINNLKGKTVDGKVKPEGVSKTQRSINSVKGKSVTVNVNSSGVGSTQGSINRIHGKTVYVNVKKREMAAFGGKMGFADGGSPRMYGKVNRGTSAPRADDVDARLSRNEWVIQAPSAKKYGDAAMSAVNQGTARILLARGGSAGGRVGELVSAGSIGGSPVVNNYYFSAPNLIGGVNELMQGLKTATKTGAIDTVARRWQKL